MTNLIHNIVILKHGKRSNARNYSRALIPRMGREGVDVYNSLSPITCTLSKGAVCSYKGIDAFIK